MTLRGLSYNESEHLWLLAESLGGGTPDYYACSCGCTKKVVHDWLVLYFEKDGTQAVILGPCRDKPARDVHDC